MHLLFPEPATHSHLNAPAETRIESWSFRIGCITGDCEVWDGRSRGQEEDGCGDAWVCSKYVALLNIRCRNGEVELQDPGQQCIGFIRVERGRAGLLQNPNVSDL